MIFFGAESAVWLDAARRLPPVRGSWIPYYMIRVRIPGHWADPT
jgi:hypothetical protein